MLNNRLKLAAISRRAALTVGLLLVAVAAPRAELLPAKIYTTADGLPRDAAWRVRRDRRGFLWFCTSEGLVRFDGYGFTLYNAEDGLPGRGVADFLETRQGVYWIATGDGLVRFNDGSAGGPLFALYKLPDVPAADDCDRLNVLYEDPQGRVWAGGKYGLFQLTEEQGRIQLRRVALPLDSANGLEISSLHRDQQGALWVGTSNEANGNYAYLYRIAPDEQVQTLRLAPGNKTLLLEDSAGRLWAGTSGVAARGPGLCRLNQTGFGRCYTRRDGFPAEWVEALYQDGDGMIWVGTAHGLVSFQPPSDDRAPQFKVYGEQQGLISDTRLATFCEDEAGNLWVATLHGVIKIVRDGFLRYTSDDGLVAARVKDLKPDRAGRLTVAVSEQRRLVLQQFVNGRFVAVRPNTPPDTSHGTGWGQSIINSRDGHWWLPSGESMIFRFPVADWRRLAQARPLIYGAPQGINDKNIWRMFEDTRGDVWVSVRNKDLLLKWERATKRWLDLTAALGQPRAATHMNKFVEDRSGAVWMASGLNGQSRLVRYKNGQFKVFTERDELPAEHLSDLHVDARGRLWLSSDAGGVGCVENPDAEPFKIKWYTSARGLSANRYGVMAEDRWGRLYIAHLRGVDRLDPATGQIKQYTTADGLPHGPFTAAYTDAQGDIWFGNLNGLGRLQPRQPAQRPPPQALLSSIRIAGETQRVAELGVSEVPLLTLKPTQNNIALDFLSPDAVHNPQLRYQYKLEGAQREWSRPTRRRTVNFAYLAPGTYRFLARVQIAEGQFSPHVASVTFHIAAPVWQRWWFISLALAVLAGAAYAAYRYRVRQLLAVERVRTRIAGDLHDDIGANLSRIAIWSEVVQQQTRAQMAATTPEANGEALARLAQIARTARETSAAMSDIVWAANPQRDHLSDLVLRMRRFASETFDAAALDWQFTAPEALTESELPLSADTRREILLIFKEAVNNIVRHAHCQRAEIKLALTAGQLHLQISDDGRGFAPSEHDNHDGGHGLESLHTRARRLNAQLRINSQPGHGASLMLDVPLKRPVWRRRWAGALKRRLSSLN